LKIDLDSRDLIRLEREPDDLHKALHDRLVASASQIVLSAGLITELSEPLFQREGKPGVMRLLNHLEALPHIWLRTVDLEEIEIASAIEAFTQVLPYRTPSPFVNGSLDTLVNVDPLVRSIYGKSAISRIVWDVAHGASRVPSVGPYAELYKRWVEANCADVARTTRRGYRDGLKAAYKRKVMDLAQGLSGREVINLDHFADHLWDQPEWCPATRLSFEAVQLLFRDAATKPQTADLNDFVPLKSIPYVNVFTTDGAKRDYLRTLREGRQSRLRNCAYWSCVIAADLDEVLRLLGDLTT
jgi:hypothetical protein